jgi:phosphosulfolactate phosphohydrolase-like enzyme
MARGSALIYDLLIAEAASIQPFSKPAQRRHARHDMAKRLIKGSSIGQTYAGFDWLTSP